VTRPTGAVVIVSRNEPALDATLTAVAAQLGEVDPGWEVVVVDASDGALDHVRRRHPAVRWMDFPRRPSGAVTIAGQRNAGVRATATDMVIFIDAACRPAAGWLTTLTAPIRAGAEQVCAGREAGSGPPLLTAVPEDGRPGLRLEAPSINLAFTRRAFDLVGGFDESFAYGSDIDFSWRLVDAGLRIRDVPGAIVDHDWGTVRREGRRGWAYGRARTRLYRKHPHRLRRAWRTDPMILTWPPFVAALPLAVLFPGYLALLAIPAWRNRGDGAARTLVHHLAFGAGVLWELVIPARPA
jgi:glycosyltransferase involved in cell wall biosynthesis